MMKQNLSPKDSIPMQKSTDLVTSLQYSAIGGLAALATISFLVVAKKSLVLSFITDISKSENILSDSETSKLVKADRMPASLDQQNAEGDLEFRSTISKWAALQGHKEMDPRQFGKLRNPTRVEIIADVKGPAEPGQIIRLTGVVRSFRNRDFLYTRWILPAGVKLVDGKIDDVLTNFKSGEEQEVSLTVEQVGKQNEQIHFEAYFVTADGEHAGNVAQFNTISQEKIDSELEANWKNTRAKVKSGQLKRIVE